MKYISLKAVLLATLAVLGVDILSGMFLAAIFSGPNFTPDMTDEQLREAARQLARNSGYLTGAMLLGTASTILGGYLAARLATRVPYYHGLAFGALAVALGALTSDDFPTWFRVVGLGLTIPAAIAGAHIWKLRGANTQ